jgi:hypothetical protein
MKRREFANGPGNVNSAQTHSELLLEEYFQTLKVQFQHEPDVPNKNMRPDYLVEHSSGSVWFEVKEFDDPRPKPTAAFDPLRAIVAKIKEARKKFREFKDCCCALVLHSKSIYRPAHVEVVLAAMLGANSSYAPLYIDRIEDEPDRFRFFSAVIILQIWHVNELWVDVRNELLARQEKGKRIMPGDDIQLLTERQYEPIRITYPNTTRCVVLENPHAHIHFPLDLCNGPFDQRWGHNGDDYTLLRIGSELEGLRQRPKKVPYLYL